MLEGKKIKRKGFFLQVLSLEASCLVLQLQKSTTGNGKSYFPGRKHNFQPKKLYMSYLPPLALWSFEFLLESLTSAAAQKVSSTL